MFFPGKEHKVRQETLVLRELAVKQGHKDLKEIQELRERPEQVDKQEHKDLLAQLEHQELADNLVRMEHRVRREHRELLVRSELVDNLV